VIDLLRKMLDKDPKSRIKMAEMMVSKISNIIRLTLG
jgi:hypothetical protein